MVVREKLQHVLDDANDTLELGVLAGLGMDYGDVPAAGVLSS